MTNETLEQRVENVQAEKSSIWYFLVSAYSSNKTVKILLTLLGEGIPYIDTIFVSGLFYLGAKTAGIAIKNAAQFISRPLKYLKNLDLKDKISESIDFLYPFGKYKRPNLMGSTLSAVTYFTGF